MEWAEYVYRGLQGVVRSLIVLAVPLIIAVQPIPFSLRILFILIWLYAAITISQRAWLVSLFAKDFDKHLLYLRCCFISLEVRNEQHGLTPAFQRLRDDVEQEKAEERLRREFTGKGLPAFFLLLHIAFYVVLAGLVAYALIEPSIVTDVLRDAETLIQRWAADATSP